MAKTNLHLNVLITNPISDLVFKTMNYTYLRRVWPVEGVLASRPPGFSGLSSKRRGSPNMLHILEESCPIPGCFTLTHFICYKVGMFRYGKWRLRRELYLTRVRGKYRDLLRPGWLSAPSTY